MADEAKIVGIARGMSSAACSRCDWTYTGQAREVDMSARGHCFVCGGDVVAMRIGKTREDSEVVLRVERDVLGRVVPGYPPEAINATVEAEARRERLRRSSYNQPYFNEEGD